MGTVYTNGTPWYLQHDFNTEDQADITDWATDTALPSAIAHASAIVTQSRVYLIGGANAFGGHNSTVYTASINSDGTLGSWSLGTAIPETVTGASTIVTKNRVYLIGGQVAGSRSNRVFTAPINSDGTLGTWEETSSFPAVLIGNQAIVTISRVYLLGGTLSTGSSSAIVYTAVINDDGTLGTWTTGTSIPTARSMCQAIVTNSKVYLLGGYTTTASNTIYKAVINSDGTLGAWETDGTLPTARYLARSVTNGGYVFLIGGITTGLLNTVIKAPIDEDGELGSWSTSSYTIPYAGAVGPVVVTNSKIYTIGGSLGDMANNYVFEATFDGGTNDYSNIGFYEVVDPSTVAINAYLPLISSSLFQEKIAYGKVSIKLPIVFGLIDAVNFCNINIVANLFKVISVEGPKVDINCSLPEISSYANNPIIAYANILFPSPSISSFGNIWKIGYVDISIKGSDVSSVLSQDLLATCSIVSMLPNITSSSNLWSVPLVNIIAPIPSISCITELPEDYETIMYRKEPRCINHRLNT